MPAFIATGVAALGASAGVAAVVGNVIFTILVNVALGAVTKAMTSTKKAGQQGGPPSVSVTVRGTVEPRRLIFGTRRTAGVLVFYGTSGSNNEYLWYVIVTSGHQVSDIKDIWLDTVKIEDANINGSTGAVTQGNYTSNLNIWRFLGTSAQTVQTDLDSAFSQWTSTHRLRGCSYIVLRMNRSETAFPTGAPGSVSALVDGALLYDPRLDSTNGGSGSHRYTDPSTWAFSRNPALALRWYLSGGSVINDDTTPLVRYGLREPASRIDDSYFTAAANVCDESVSGANAPPSGSQSRYEINLEVTTGETRRAIIEAMLATCAGRLVTVHGKWRAYAGDYETPVHTITQDDLFGDMEVQDTTPHSERFNAVAAVFPDASNDYVDRTTPFRTDSAYETQDGGERIPLEIELRGVTDQYQAQRLAEIKLRQSRMMRTVKIVGGLNLLKVALHENVTFSHSRYSWSSRVFRCVERQFEYNEDAGKVSLTLQQEASTVYADMLTADYTTGTSDTDEYQTETPEAPSALTITGMRDGLMLSWTLGSFWQLHGIVEVWRYTASTPFANATKIWEGRGSSTFIPQNSLTTYYYWIRIRTINGKTSATYPASVGQSGAPVSITKWVATGNCIAGDSSAYKSGGSGAWDSSVYTLESYPQCHVQFRPVFQDKYLMVSLNADPSTDSNWTSLDYAWYVQGDGLLSIREFNTGVGADGSYGPYTSETVLAITYDGSTITYLKDNVSMRTVSVSSLVLYGDSSFYTAGGAVADLHFGPGTALESVDRTPTLKLIQDSEFSLDTGQRYWYWGSATGVSISLTGGVSGGRMIMVADGAAKYVFSNHVPGVKVITGQQFKMYVRWRRVSSMTYTVTADDSLVFVAYTTPGPQWGGVYSGSGNTSLSGTTINAVNVNEWQETSFTITVTNVAKSSSQYPYLVVAVVMAANVLTGTIEIDQVELTAI